MYLLQAHLTLRLLLFALSDPTNYTLDTNAAQGATKNLFFRMTMPSTATLLSNHNAAVTIIASAP
jgi:hypothetical protein